MDYLISEEITLQDDQQAYQEHDNGNFINGMHSPYVKSAWPGGVLLSEEITEYFVYLEELPQPVATGPLIWLFMYMLLLVTHCLKTVQWSPD